MLLSFSVFSPPSSPLTIIITIIIVLISPLNPLFNVTSAWARGWVAGKAGFWGVLATWVRGWQLQPPGS